MPIKILNSLTRKKEPFNPLNPSQVNIYTCGVTVYDECHIGHARSLYIFDVLRRFLEYRGYKVNFVRNITDIDDKIINRANELKTDWQDLVSKYIDFYYKDLARLGIDKGILDGKEEPRATKNIPEMIKHIEGLIKKGYAYESGGDVYFEVRKFKEYGKLSGQSIEQMQSGARIEPSESKKDPLDFALWKRSKENEPSWDSPWGKGRPGWHIECSVMSTKYLNTETLDIHAGGRDLIFPHHENEIAQAEALTGKPFAKYWMHHGLLTINGQKMAKSLGNFITIDNFIWKEKDIDVLKLFFLSACYQQPIDYNGKKIEESRQSLERILILKDKIDKKIAESAAYNPALKQFKELKDIKNQFIEQMDDDFNTPEGLARIHDLVTVTNKNLENIDFIFQARNLLLELKDIFGLELKTLSVVPKTQNIDVDKVLSQQHIELSIRQRNKLRKEGDFQAADRIRKELEENGIVLEDTKDGKTTWRRKL